jgi:tetratricopeptide (TPR) repeat protein
LNAPPPTCPKCGRPLDPVTGLCEFCSFPADEPQPEGGADARERELGLLLFEAEEALARGAAEKAVVLASKAVKDRPDSLTARALHERARRELLRGRRRDRLEARVREAEALLAGGDAAGAERIVTSALKLIPSHPVALALFTKLKERRQQAPTAEAWAEQELERLTKARARRSLEAANVEMAAGRERAAMLVIRRGLRHSPDDPELLARLRDVEKAMERGKAGQHAVQAQVRAGLDLLAQGQADESLRVLRAVLRADPENVPAQVAIQQVRKAWLRRQAVAAAAPPEVAAPAPPAPAPPAASAAPPATPAVPAASPPRPPASPAPARPAAPVAAPPPSVRPPSPPPPSAPPTVTPPAPRPAPAASWEDVEAAARGKTSTHARRPAAPAPGKATVRALPPEPERRALPMGAILAGAAILVGVILIAVVRRGPQPPAPTPAAPVTAARGPVAPSRATPAPAASLAGPLDAADAGLRQTVETILAAYARALETADADALARVRPDLGAEERARLIAAFTGALNAATDLRVLDVKQQGDLATVSVLRTDVIVGGSGAPRDPTEETLRFWRRRGEWLLVR